MKPEGKWRCRACGKIWDGSQLHEKPGYTSPPPPFPPPWWTCHDLFCGGTCDRVQKEEVDEAGNKNPAMG